MSGELVAALEKKGEMEFKPLFDVVHLKLTGQKLAGTGADMMRLSAYEKLQRLVIRGAVRKEGKMYRAVKSPATKPASRNGRLKKKPTHK